MPSVLCASKLIHKHRESDCKFRISFIYIHALVLHSDFSAILNYKGPVFVEPNMFFQGNGEQPEC